MLIELTGLFFSEESLLFHVIFEVAAWHVLLDHEEVVLVLESVEHFDNEAKNRVKK